MKKNYTKVIVPLLLTFFLYFYYITQKHLSSYSYPYYKDQEKYLTLQFDDKELFLLVDVDCLSSLSKGEYCKGPITVAGSKHYSNESVNVIYSFENDPSKHYLKFKGIIDGIFITRLMPRYKIKREIVKVSNYSFDLNIPVDFNSFTRNWEKSEFIKCKNYEYERPNVTRLLSLDNVNVFRDYNNFAHKWNTTFLLFGGTLLGWYRECDLIPHTQDLDLSIPSYMIHPPFLNALQETFEVKKVYGRDNDSLEFSLLHKNMPTDLFFKYSYNSSHDICGSLNFKPFQQIFSLYPKMERICSGDLHGHLVYVPCNVEDMLKIEYGNWTEDLPRGKSYNYAKSPKNLIVESLTKEEFLKLQRNKWS